MINLSMAVTMQKFFLAKLQWFVRVQQSIGQGAPGRQPCQCPASAFGIPPARRHRHYPTGRLHFDIAERSDESAWSVWLAAAAPDILVEASVGVPRSLTMMTVLNNLLRQFPTWS
ncbi:hypothetical protein VTO73DRAFT_4372 [Trametes versicolor]